MKILLHSFLLFFTILGTAQRPLTRNNIVESYRFENQDSTVTITSESEISAIVVKSKQHATYRILISDRPVIIPRDHDIAEPTYFISLQRRVKTVQLIAPTNVGFEVHLIKSGQPPKLDSEGGRTSATNKCNEVPNYVPQSTWRDGLPDPSYKRSFHKVFHNVIHHSAGSNFNTNYAQVIRDIYLYHTQVNGWSDIGYNYLIAQDGRLFAGRDPGNGSQDNVRGAHFCGSNSGTLGICLLGNYETATPTSESINTLQELLTYQLLDQEHTPFERFNHPLGNLGTIIGHRDGCATLCPGENVYSILNEIQISVDEELLDCQIVVPLALDLDTTLIEVGQVVEIRALGSYDEFVWVLPKGLPFPVYGNSVEVSYSSPGFYDVTLIGINDLIRDTLELEKYLQVSLLETEPTIYPNPTNSLSEIKIDFTGNIVSSMLHDINGKLVGLWNSTPSERTDLKPGTYFLTIESESRVFRKKIIIL